MDRLKSHDYVVAHPAKVVLDHSDRGSTTYASSDYQRVLEEFSSTCSMSRRGDCWDNAVAESFLASLKREVEELDHLVGMRAA